MIKIERKKKSGGAICSKWESGGIGKDWVKGGTWLEVQAEKHMSAVQ